MKRVMLCGLWENGLLQPERRIYYECTEIDGKIFIRRTCEHQCGDYVTVEVFDTMDYDLLAEEVEEA